MSDLKRMGYIPISRELALDMGLIDPTPAERAENERLAAEWRRREASYRERMTVVREQLAAVTDPVARAVLDLHRENEHGECMGDEFDGYDGERPGWPCDTIRAVAKVISVDVPEGP